MAYSHLLIYFTMYINNFFFHYIFKHVRRNGWQGGIERAGHRAAGYREKSSFMKPDGL